MKLFIALLAAAFAFNPARAEPISAPSFEVRILRDQQYRELGAGETTAGKNQLDLYLPEGAKDFPVVMLVHGGAWVFGGKSFDNVPGLGRALAKQGIGAVGVNYRLSPGVQHPGHIRDVADAFAWVHKNIAQYGGRGERISVMGHSAGGHLVALLGADESHLKRVGLSRQNVQCVIGVSGVYQISDVALNMGRRRQSEDGKISKSQFEMIFGSEKDAGKQASPLAHVNEGLPPYLLIYAEDDLPTLGLQAMAFNAALRSKEIDSTLLKVERRNHVTVMWKASLPADPVLTAATALVRRTMGKE